jgi:hypothetical protein
MKKKTCERYCCKGKDIKLVDLGDTYQCPHCYTVSDKTDYSIDTLIAKYREVLPVGQAHS